MLYSSTKVAHKRVNHVSLSHLALAVAVLDVALRSNGNKVFPRALQGAITHLDGLSVVIHLHKDIVITVLEHRQQNVGGKVGPYGPIHMQS